MLTHVGSHHGVGGHLAAHRLHDLLGRQRLVLTGLKVLLHCQNVLFPLLVVVLGQVLVQHLQHAAGRADDMVICQHILVDLSAVDVDVDDLGLLGEGGGIEGHTVGEAAAHGDQQIALIAGDIGATGAMHADHAGGKGMAAGETAAAHDRDGYRSIQFLGKLAELLMGAAAHHTAAADEERLLRLGDHLTECLHVLLVDLAGSQLMGLAEGFHAAAGAVLLPGDELILHHLIGSGDAL